MTTRLELLPDVYLTAVQTSRFKTACFSLSFLRPLRQEEAGMNALLPSVLLRGSESAPSIRAIADRLDALCGASVGSLVRKKGEIQLTGLFADGLEDRYAGEPVFSRLLELTAELLLRPERLATSCAALWSAASKPPRCASALQKQARSCCRSGRSCSTRSNARSTTRPNTARRSCCGRCAAVRPTP